MARQAEDGAPASTSAWPGFCDSLFLEGPNSCGLHQIMVVVSCFQGVELLAGPDASGLTGGVCDPGRGPAEPYGGWVPLAGLDALPTVLMCSGPSRWSSSAEAAGIPAVLSTFFYFCKIYK